MMKKCILICLIIIASTIHAKDAQEYSYKLLSGPELQTIIPFMAMQRISAFREYPYLYEGNNTEENEYCQWFTSLPHSAVAVAYANGEPVGFVSGTGFAGFDVHFKGSIALFKKNGLDSKKFYYIPEAIIVPEHRKHSLIEKLHDVIEQRAKALGYSAICCAEESHDNHPLKPAGYQSRDRLFLKGGYSKTNMSIKFPWLTIQPDGTLKDEEHSLSYWIKNL